MNLEPVMQSELSQKEKDKYHILMHIYIYIWNLEKWYWSINLGSHNRDADIQNRLVDIVGEGEGRMNWQS